jgi:alcohol dehydrogenase class IV
MRYNARGVAGELAETARAMGLSGADDADLAEAACRAVHDLVAAIGLPQRLRDAGVAEADLPGLAQAALSSSAVRNNPVRITGADELETVYRAAW